METIVKEPRIPLEQNNIQYNHCKNVKCANFGIPEDDDALRGEYKYILTGLNKGYGNIPLLKCNCCSETFPVKSNYGISEELKRITAYLNTDKKAVCCSDSTCPNHTVPVGTKKAYASFGTTRNGAKRYRCNLCKKTVSVAVPTQGQHDTHKNIEIFKMLVNKAPLNRIIEMADISWEVLYNRIDFIYKQCLAFSSNRENKLKSMDLKRLYISVDRQDYTINWSERKDKRNIILNAIASADNTTGYIFGINPNFDYHQNKEDIEKEVLQNGDLEKSHPFRKFAHIWLEQDYIDTSKTIRYGKRAKVANNLKEEISNRYDEGQERDDIEVSNTKSIVEKLPDYGVQIHAEYTMIAHFHMLKQMMPNVEKWRFFLDQDSGIRGACLSAFANEVKEHTAEAFYVKIEKVLTVDEKRKFKAKSNKLFKEIKALNPNLSDTEIKMEMWKNEIKSVLHLGPWKDSWVHHPLPNMAEANKSLCWLTEHQDFDIEHQAWLYNKASLHGVDSFFQQIRRRVAMLERAIHSSSSAGRTWNGYGAYNPAMVTKLLLIAKTFHNYIYIRKGEKTTAAMRLGLADAPIDHKTILYYE